MSDYPQNFQKYRPGTFFLNGLQYGIQNLEYHAMNEYGEYEPYLAFSNPIGYKKDRECIQLEAEKLRKNQCVVINKEIPCPLFNILNNYAYYGQKYLNEEEFSELNRVQSDNIAFQKMMHYLMEKHHLKEGQILKELYS